MSGETGTWNPSAEPWEALAEADRRYDNAPEPMFSRTYWEGIAGRLAGMDWLLVPRTDLVKLVMIAVDKGNLVHWAAPVPVPGGDEPVDPEGDAAYWRAKYENVCSTLKTIHGLIEQFEAGVESLGDGQFKFWADDLVSLGWARLFAEKPDNIFAEAPVPAPVPVPEEPEGDEVTGDAIAHLATLVRWVLDEADWSGGNERFVEPLEDALDEFRDADADGSLAPEEPEGRLDVSHFVADAVWEDRETGEKLVIATTPAVWLDGKDVIDLETFVSRYRPAPSPVEEPEPCENCGAEGVVPTSVGVDRSQVLDCPECAPEINLGQIWEGQGGQVRVVKPAKVLSTRPDDDAWIVECLTSGEKTIVRRWAFRERYTLVSESAPEIKEPCENCGRHHLDPTFTADECRDSEINPPDRSPSLDLEGLAKLDAEIAGLRKNPMAWRSESDWTVRQVRIDALLMAREWLVSEGAENDA